MITPDKNYPLSIRDSATEWMYRLTQEIEKCGASVQLTRAVTLAGELMDRIQAHERKHGTIDIPQYPHPKTFDTVPSTIHDFEDPNHIS
jgi:hypothetical protein